MKRVSIVATACVIIAVAVLCAATVFAAAEKASPMAAPEIGTKSAGTADAPQSLSGKVVETMNAGGYTYVLLEKNGKKTWVAVPQMKIAVGQEASFQPGAEMPKFTSKSLGRTFDSIIFSAGPVASPHGAGAASAAVQDIAGQQSPGSKAAVTPASKGIKVEKATGPNAYTVAEIFAKRADVDNKPVVIRGQVVKVSAGIMGKNFIHLQDGTGDPKKSTHNLVVTSDDLPSVGDVVTVKGTAIKDKDFGSGYKYTVIIEKATITK